ncbi:hypothetical protein H2198_010409 [Neophaeococcomyces mojaviensis]|uniref:Uncharacterized protein n=1 Tax=Neophaeococcomyces mojaviensis TaxID=3383035 RepID=A0ACC2ZRP2_9EURO|nr:hypothetical protein H2198_010409 [Knufia sp. JES_112]
MPPTPTPYHGYQPQPAPMMYNGNGPQFATFDAPSNRDIKTNEDSLPAMPSWSNATTRQVEDHSQRQGHNMEMGRMQAQPQRTRGAYSQIAPSSPVREDYPQSQHHASDLGAQRLDQHRNHSYDEFQETPLSPAPTYYSTVPPAGTYRSTPQNTVSPPPQNHYANAAPYPSSRESTLFESQSNSQSYAPRSIAPPAAPSYSPYESYQSPQQDPHGAHTPSLLMVGRKPVPNSYREV